VTVTARVEPGSKTPAGPARHRRAAAAISPGASPRRVSLTEFPAIALPVADRGLGNHRARRRSETHRFVFVPSPHEVLVIEPPGRGARDAVLGAPGVGRDPAVVVTTRAPPRRRTYRRGRGGPERRRSSGEVGRHSCTSKQEGPVLASAASAIHPGGPRPPSATSPDTRGLGEIRGACWGSRTTPTPSSPHTAMPVAVTTGRCGSTGIADWHRPTARASWRGVTTGRRCSWNRGLDPAGCCCGRPISGTPGTIWSSGRCSCRRCMKPSATWRTTGAAGLLRRPGRGTDGPGQ
jgi:hypothetical protein